MDSLQEVLPVAGWPRFAWDTFWQSTTIGLGAWIALRWLVKHPSMRAATALIAVALMLSAPVLSWGARSLGIGLLASPVQRPYENSPLRNAAQELAAATEDESTTRGADATGNDEQPAEHLTAGVSDETVTGARGQSTSATSESHYSLARVSGWNWLALTWILFSTAIGLRLLKGGLKLRRICRAAVPCDSPHILANCRKAATRVQLRRQPIVLRSREVPIPAVVAFGCPRLLVPAQSSDRSDAEWYDIFCHELAHVRRHDGWALLFLEIARVVLPWQPLIRWLGQEHARACEDACDDWVIATGSDPIDFATVLTEWIPRRTPKLLIGFNGHAGQASQRIARLLKIESPPTPQLSGWQMTGIVALSCLLVTSVALMQTNGAMAAALAVESGEPASRTDLPGLVPDPGELPNIGRWQVATRDVQGHANSIAWSPDGTLVAFAESSQIRIYEAQSLRLARILVGHTAMVRSVAWSPDGQWLVSGGDDRTVRVWTADGRPGSVIRNHTSSVMCVAWSPTSQYFVSAGADFTVRVWDLIGSPARVFKGHTAIVQAVAWSPTDEWIASAGDDKTLRLWNWRSGTEQVRAGHEYPVTCLAWHPDGDRIATGDANPDNRYEPGNVRMWYVDGQPGASVVTSRGGCAGVAWSREATDIIVAGASLAIGKWRPDENAVRDFASGVSEFECVAVSPNGQHIAGGGTLCIWDAEGKLQQRLDKRLGQAVWTLAWNPTGSLIAAGEYRGAVQLWNSDGMPGRRLLMDDREQMHWALQALDWSPDGTRLAAGAADTAVWLWDTDGTKVTKLTSAGEHVVCAAWSPDGTQVALAGMKPAGLGVKSPAWVELWNSDGTKVRRFDELPHAVESLAWSPDGQRVVAGCFDGTVRIWNKDGNAGPIMSGHDSWVISVDWSPNGQWIASGGVDDLVRLWKPDGTAGPVLQGHTGDVRSVTWSPDGEWLVSGSWDNTVRLWKPDGTAGPVLEGHGSWVYSVAWSPDSQRLVSGSLDGSIRVWNVSTQQTEWLGFILPQGELISMNAAGDFLHGDTATIEREFVYLVESPTGAMDALSPSEFRRQIGGDSTN